MITENDNNKDQQLGNILLLCFIVVITILSGLTMLYSATFNDHGSSFFIRQLSWIIVGVLAALTIVSIGYKKLSDFSLMLTVISIILLLLARFCFPPINGAYRWIKIPYVGSLQPSEFAKLAILLFISKYCADNIRFINNVPFLKMVKLSCAVVVAVGLFTIPYLFTDSLWIHIVAFSISLILIMFIEFKKQFFTKSISIIFLKKGLIPPIFWVCLISSLILMGKDLGTTILLTFVSLSVFFIAGVQLKYFIWPLGLAAALVPFLKYFDPERWSRLTSFINPELYQKSDGYQLWLSILALGSGGGYGQGFMESNMKRKYLPENHTDFILSIIGEELGLIGTLAVIALYLLFIFITYKICIKARNKHGMILGFGLTALIMTQAIINIGVVSGSFPTKGMPLPFISYGGSNIVMCLCAVGLIISISIDSFDLDFNKNINYRIKKYLKKLFSKKENI